MNTIAGMRRAMKDGRHVNIAPMGYKNIRNEDDRPVIVPNKDAPFIKWIFEEMIREKSHVFDFLKEVRKKELLFYRRSATKARVCEFILRRKLIFDNKSFRTIPYRMVISLIVNPSVGFSESKNKKKFRIFGTFLCSYPTWSRIEPVYGGFKTSG